MPWLGKRGCDTTSDWTDRRGIASYANCCNMGVQTAPDILSKQAHSAPLGAAAVSTLWPCVSIEYRSPLRSSHIAPDNCHFRLYQVYNHCYALRKCEGVRPRHLDRNSTAKGCTFAAKRPAIVTPLLRVSPVGLTAHASLLCAGEGQTQARAAVHQGNGDDCLGNVYQDKRFHPIAVGEQPRTLLFSCQEVPLR